MLPNPSITPIPNNEPDAVPSLWNVRYQEIDENFDNLDNRAEAIESEIEAARAGKPNLSETINAIVTQIGGISGTLNGLPASGAVPWSRKTSKLEFQPRRDGRKASRYLQAAL